LEKRKQLALRKKRMGKRLKKKGRCKKRIMEPQIFKEIHQNQIKKTKSSIEQKKSNTLS